MGTESIDFIAVWQNLVIFLQGASVDTILKSLGNLLLITSFSGKLACFYYIVVFLLQ